MPVERNDAPSRLQLRLQTGVDGEGNPVFKLKSYSNVKPGATDEDVFLVGEALGQLQQHLVQEVLRHDSAVLTLTEI